MKLVHDPFDHVVVEGMFDESVLAAAADEFPAPDWRGWQRFDNSNERKLASTTLGPACDDVIDAMMGLAPEVGEVFGMSPLLPSIHGGGMHMILPGGYLNIHVDFTDAAEPNVPQYRRANMLLFLNDDVPDNTGDLMLVGPRDDIVSVVPSRGTLAVFATSDHSYHGHPVPLAWDHPRKSLAIYLYSHIPYLGYMEPHSTVFA